MFVTAASGRTSLSKPISPFFWRELTLTVISIAVGSVVVQLAKLDGCRVIASAGSDAKCDDVRAMGADVVFNYKTQSTKDVLQREGPLDMCVFPVA